MTDKNLFISDDQKRKLRELGYLHRSSMSGVVRDIVDEYAAGTITVTPPAVDTFPVGMKFAPPESYEAALTRAEKEGVSLAFVIRTEIDRRAKEAGL